MLTILNFFQDNFVARMILDSFFTIIYISFIIFVVIKYKKALNLFLIGLLLHVIFFISESLGLEMSKTLYGPFVTAYIVLAVILLAPELRKTLESSYKKNDKNDMIISSTQATKEAIVDAVFNMSFTKIGALITIEQHNSLDQYAERAIQLNSDISRELLEQIFIKDSPLHDGGVIIRGNKIVCAGAYYVLTQDDRIDKTVGSRHRAGIGISEVTDSLTIIVSEETGSVHVATAGCMVSISSKSGLLEYIDLFLGK